MDVFSSSIDDPSMIGHWTLDTLVQIQILSHHSIHSQPLFYSKDVTTLEEHDDSMFKQEKSPFVHLGYALWFAVLAHTDIVCYIMVFINQVSDVTSSFVRLKMERLPL